MSDLIGQTIGNYRIEALLGAGGMARVFRARHVHLDRLAALKVMHENLAADPGFQARFRQEARAVAALHHPHIVEVFDFGEADGRLYLVLELLEGGSLRGRVQGYARQGQAPPLPEGLALARQAADALAFAHAQGMVHRDVKPDNMLLEKDVPGRQPCLKISDFGLARLASGGVMTASGVTMGTPAYMSPEQCQGADLDARSDLYSLGVVLYEVATGYLPFEVRTLSEAVYKHVYAAPPAPRSVRPDLPGELEDVILRCLAKTPGERFGSAAELSAAIGRIGGDPMLTQLDRTLIGPPPLPPTPASDPGTVARALSVSSAPPQVQSLGGGSGLPRLQVLDRDGALLRVVELTGDGLTLGRLQGNDVVLSDDGVSRHHLRVDWDGSQVMVTDLGSSNGTLMDGARLLPQVPQGWPWRGMMRVGPYWLRLEEPRVSASAAAGGGIATRQSLLTGGGRLALVLEKDVLTLIPGQAAVLRTSVANLGSTVDHLTVGVEGVPAAWVEGGGTPVQLNPGGQAQVALTVTVPRAPESRAGEYPVTVRVRSVENPAESGAASARWSVAPFTGSAASLKPARAGGVTGAAYLLTVENRGNCPKSYALTGTDDEGTLEYGFERDRIALEPGQAEEVRLRVRAPRRWIGNPQTRPFTLKVKPEDGDAPQAASGQFVHRAVLPVWAPPAAAAVLAGCIWLAGQFKPKPPAPPPDPQVVMVSGAYEPGQEVDLLGVGLGSEGKATLGGRPVTPEAWKPDLVRFRVPQDTARNTPLQVVLLLPGGTQLPGGSITVVQQLSAEQEKRQEDLIQQREQAHEEIRKEAEVRQTEATTGGGSPVPTGGPKTQPGDEPKDTPVGTGSTEGPVTGGGGSGDPIPQEEPKTPAVIRSFAVTDATVIEGSDTTLKWSVEGAREIEVRGFGKQPAGKTSLTVTPPGAQVKTARTYTLEAVGTDGVTQSSQLSVTVIPKEAVVLREVALYRIEAMRTVAKSVREAISGLRADTGPEGAPSARRPVRSPASRLTAQTSVRLQDLPIGRERLRQREAPRVTPEGPVRRPPRRRPDIIVPGEPPPVAPPADGVPPAAPSVLQEKYVRLGAATTRLLGHLIGFGMCGDRARYTGGESLPFPMAQPNDPGTSRYKEQGLATLYNRFTGILGGEDETAARFRQHIQPYEQTDPLLEGAYKASVRFRNYDAIDAGSVLARQDLQKVEELLQALERDLPALENCFVVK